MASRIKIYLDTEFIECPYHLELVSVGLVKETGETYYAISAEFDESKASDWVKEHIISKLEGYVIRKPLNQIKEEILDFIGYQMAEIWAYYGTQDWMLMLWLYGGMSKLPYNFPMYCRELRQEVDRIGFPESSFPQNPNRHHPLSDAKWNRELHNRLLAYEKNKQIT